MRIVYSPLRPFGTKKKFTMLGTKCKLKFTNSSKSGLKIPENLMVLPKSLQFRPEKFTVWGLCQEVVKQFGKLVAKVDIKGIDKIE